MLNATEKKTEKLYSVHCPECGKLIDNKFFPLDSLLEQYSIDGKKKDKVKKMVSFLGIGALYGKPILPEVEPFVQKDGSWNFQSPFSFAGKILPEFTCSDNEIRKEKLTPVDLNIASMIAQFCLVTGFRDIYPMLELRKEMDDAIESGEELSAQQVEQWNRYCDSIVRIPGVTVDALLTTDMRNKLISGIMSDILAFARKEALQQDKRHFAAQQVLVGWRYKMENNRRMPFALVARGDLVGSFDIQTCCCDKCRRPLHWEMGAYLQKVVGILGTQAVGKTTYLMALTDVIRGVKFEKMTITHDSTDPQWRRVETEGSGVLWRYQNGFPPQKTAVGVGQAPALTFKVQKDKESEPIMLTMADIPGEAFYNSSAAQFPQDMIVAIKSLLLASDCLILMVNSDQLREMSFANDGTESNTNKLVKDASKILTAFKDYLPKHPIATAVVLTAADKLGDLRQLLELAYDVRKLPPLVYSDKEEKYVYNTEAMNAATGAVGAYMNRSFDQFVHNLANGFVPAGSPLAAFAVSSGTQWAADDFSPRPDTNTEKAEADRYDREAAGRYEKMRQGRFGVEAPLLWLLACDGLLNKGRTDEYFDRYDAKSRKRILNVLSREES